MLFMFEVSTSVIREVCCLVRSMTPYNLVVGNIISENRDVSIFKVPRRRRQYSAFSVVPSQNFAQHTC